MPQTLPFDLQAIDWSGLLTPVVAWALAGALVLAALHAVARIILARRIGTFRLVETLRFLETDGLKILAGALWDIAVDGIPQDGTRYAARTLVLCYIARVEYLLLAALHDDWVALFAGPTAAPAGPPGV